MLSYYYIRTWPVKFYILILLIYNNMLFITSNNNTRELIENNIVTFVPWPHLKVFNGYLEDGEWYAGNKREYNNIVDKIDRLDNIQKHSLKEGFFKPFQKNFEKYHIFTSSEANRCLRGRKIYFFGDSYSRQFFIGLADIVLDRPTNDEIINGLVREQVVASTTKELKEFLGKTAIIKTLPDECRHGDLQCLLTHIVTYSREIERCDVFIGNILVHHMTLHQNEENYINTYQEQLVELFKMKKDLKLTWTTGPSYAINRVPEQYRDATKSKPTELMNFKAIDTAEEYDVPLLDFFSLTHACKWKNCSSDGGHRARYVNRMKAQMLLNNLCDIS